MLKLPATKLRRFWRKKSSGSEALRGRGTVTSAPLGRDVSETKHRGRRGDVRAEETTLAGQDSDVDVGSVGDLAEVLGEGVVVVLGHGIELLLVVEGDDGNVATLILAVLEGYDWVCHVDGFGICQ